MLLMENFALISLVEELKRAADRVVIRRIIQHQPNGFIFQTRGRNLPAFKVLLDARNPALYASGSRPPVDAPVTDFLMVLRKHLNAARLTEITKPLAERIVEFKFATVLPSNQLETVVLVVELLPNSPNLLLLDAGRRLLASFTRPSSQHGIEEYDEYRYPKVAGKVDLDEVLESDTYWFDEKEFEKKGKTWLIENIAGIGPLFAAEIAHRHAAQGLSVPETMLELLTQLQDSSGLARLYSEHPLTAILEQNDLTQLGRVDVSPIELGALDRRSSQTYPSIMEASCFYFDELESRTLLEKAKSPRRRLLKGEARRLKSRRDRLVRRRQRFEEASLLNTTGQMLVSSGAAMDEHHDTVTVTDYFGDEPRMRKVPVDSSISLRANVSKMFKRYQKAGRGMGRVERQLKELDVLEESLRGKTSQLAGIRDWDTWLAVSEKTGKRTPDGKPNREARPAARRGRSHIQIDGHEVLVGRNGRENDELTFKVAAADDFWLHVAEYAGSHVIVRNPAKEKVLDEPVLVRAAQLAAFHSQARNSNKVDVHYTRRRFVTKPRKAKPGLVHLREFKTISVEPKAWSPPEVD
jgi:predicted ribosome quality control (RQC) complex YloA/Tae2 family protein